MKVYSIHHWSPTTGHADLGISPGDNAAEALSRFVAAHADEYRDYEVSKLTPSKRREAPGGRILTAKLLH